MKTTTQYILFAIFTLSSIVTFAMTPEFPLKRSELKKEIFSNLKFAQFVPVAADFEELPLKSLAPTTPKEAAFDDEAAEPATLTSLAPVTPREATFDE